MPLDNIAKMLPENWQVQDYPNVWLGATVVNQAEADRDIPKLLAVPARVRFLSVEPMLGPISLTNIQVGGGHGHHEFDPIVTGNALKRADPAAPSLRWVICGGESGPKARPMRAAWAQSLRDQCDAAGVPFLFKQWGEWIGADQAAGALAGTDEASPGAPSDYSVHIGKKASGRLLDGRTHDGFPA